MYEETNRKKIINHRKYITFVFRYKEISLFLYLVFLCFFSKKSCVGKPMTYFKNFKNVLILNSWLLLLNLKTSTKQKIRSWN